MSPKQTSETEETTRRRPQDEAERLEQEAGAVLSDLLSEFKRKASEENRRLLDAVDSEYWVCLCFQTREQKEEFLQLKGWACLGDKYLDGLKIAKAEGLKLTSRVPQMPKGRPFDEDWIRLVSEDELGAKDHARKENLTRENPGR